jgi:hypothetical protein
MSSEQQGGVKLSWYVGGEGYFPVNLDDLRPGVISPRPLLFILIALKLIEVLLNYSP